MIGEASKYGSKSKNDETHRFDTSYQVYVNVLGDRELLDRTGAEKIFLLEKYDVSMTIYDDMRESDVMQETKRESEIFDARDDTIPEEPS